MVQYCCCGGVFWIYITAALKNLCKKAFFWPFQLNSSVRNGGNPMVYGLKNWYTHGLPADTWFMHFWWVLLEIFNILLAWVGPSDWLQASITRCSSACVWGTPMVRGSFFSLGRDLSAEPSSFVLSQTVREEIFYWSPAQLKSIAYPIFHGMIMLCDVMEK